MEVLRPLRLWVFLAAAEAGVGRPKGTQILNDMTDYDKDKVDEIVLALLYLNAFSDRYATRAWKSFDWDAMDRLYEKGYIDDPKSKAKSVILTDEGF